MLVFLTEELVILKWRCTEFLYLRELLICMLPLCDHVSCMDCSCVSLRSTSCRPISVSVIDRNILGIYWKFLFVNLNMLWWLPFTYNYLILFSTKSLHTLGAYHTPSATNLNFKSLKLGRHELVAANFRLQVLHVESLC